ncbi:MAG: phosphotransferase [Myxococcales bacterium]|nr:phosphotransferase [Myxococcales bacterium]
MTSSTSIHPPVHQLLSAWGLSSDTLEIIPITTGLINLTYHIKTSAGAQYALQRLAPIFGREVHEDIAAVTEHLSKKKLHTPRLIPTQQGEWDLNLGSNDQGIWRLMSWVSGECISRVTDTFTAHEAGLALGHFHAALADYSKPFAHQRIGVHDTDKHVDNLRSSLQQTPIDHPEYSIIQSLGETILSATESIPVWDRGLERIVHGDPKISNLIFDSKSGKWRAWIDLDTVSRMHIPLELGDAFRSWCNASGEDTDEVSFDFDLFSAGVDGYAKGVGGSMTMEEKEALVPAIYQITIELAARFCRDAIEDRYFGWDPKRFPSRMVHNRVRAAAQLRLGRDLQKNMPRAISIVQSASW